MRSVFALILTWLFCIHGQSQIKSIDPSFSVKEKVIVVNEMPPYKSQDTIGNCSFECASLLLNKAICDHEKKDCSSLGPEQQVSSAAMSGLGKERGLNFFNGDNSYNALVGAREIDTDYEGYITEKCFSLNGILGKIGGAGSEVTNKIQLEKLRTDQGNAWNKLYTIYHKAKTTQGNFCLDCELTKDLSQALNLNIENAKKLKNMSEITYAMFLSKVLRPGKCPENEMLLVENFQWNPKTFPREPQKVTNEMLEENIGNQLSQKRPLCVSICNLPNAPKYGSNCSLKIEKNSDLGKTYCSVKDFENITSNTCEVEFGHTLAITGQRKACKSKTECKTEYRVQNSQGKSWQDANNDGWVDGEDLMKRMNYKDGRLGITTWIEQGPQRAASK